jgi:hypothetical protein
MANETRKNKGNLVFTEIIYQIWLLCRKSAGFVLLNVFHLKPAELYGANALKNDIEDRFLKDDSLNVYSINTRQKEKHLLQSKLCVEADFHTEWFKKWSKMLDEKSPILQRKTWEFITVAQALNERNMITEGKRGLGFGVGKEPLPSLFASRHCYITATDINADSQKAKLWQKTEEHSSQLQELFRKDICDFNTFEKYVSFQSVDMNEIPVDLTDFDFTWSSCAFEHLGSIQKGIDFVINQMSCLKKGGWAVHTTEFNLTSNNHTFETENLVLFRRRDIEQLIDILNKKGFYVEELDTSVGLSDNDFFIDYPPFKQHKSHLKVRFNHFITTSLVLIIQK